MPPNETAHVVEVAARLALVGWGMAAVSDEDAWVRADASAVPEVRLSSSRQVVFSDAVEFEGDVFVVGTRMTVLRFDGEEWRLENQHVGLSPRSTHGATLEVCDGRVRALSIAASFEREADGTWRRLGSGAAAWSCTPEVRTPRPDERCGNHTPWDRVVRCRAGVRVWSERRERWLALPDDVAWTRWRASAVAEHEDGVFFLGDEELVHTADGAAWTREVVGAGPILHVFASERRVHAVTPRAVYVRDLCE